MPPLKEYLTRRKEGSGDESAFCCKTPIHRQIDEVTAPPDSPVAQLQAQEEPFPPGEIGWFQGCDGLIEDAQPRMVADDLQAVVDEAREAETPALLDEKLPVDPVCKGMDCKVDIANKNQAVEGMTNPQGVFAQVD